MTGPSVNGKTIQHFLRRHVSKKTQGSSSLYAKALIPVEQSSSGVMCQITCCAGIVGGCLRAPLGGVDYCAQQTKAA